MKAYNTKSRIMCLFLSMIFGFAGVSVTSAFRAAAPEKQAVQQAADSDADSLVDASRGYAAVIYNNTNGLPTSEANAIAQTSEGFMWIGSYSGLIKYDGNNFERVNSAETGITSVISLMVDSKDRLWAGTNDNGVGVLNKGEWKLFNKDNGLPSQSIHAIVEDGNGLVYLATTEGIAVVRPDMSVSIPQEASLKTLYIRCLELGPDNLVYALTKEGEIFTMRDGEMVEYFHANDFGIPDTQHIHAILPDPDNAGKVYFATEGSELYYGELRGRLRKPYATLEPLAYVNSIHKYLDEVWLCTDNGIGRVINNGQGMVVLENLPMTTSIEGMTADYQNNLWFVSSQQGVMKIVPSRFSNLYEQYELSDDVVYSTLVSDGRLYIGTKTSGLIVMENQTILSEIPLEMAFTMSGNALPSTNLIEIFKNEKIRSKIRSIYKDSKGNIWFCSFSKYPLVCYNGRTAVGYSMAEGLPSDRVRAVYECADGSMAVACTGGVAILRDNAVTKVYDEKDGIENTEVLTAIQAANGDLLAGTDGGGIYVIADGKLRLINTGNSDLKSDIVMRIKKDKTREIYWIVTSNSIAYMTSDYEVVTIKNFPYSNNFDIYQNKYDEMWILSSNGIYVVPTEEMLANKEIVPFFYGRENGLSCYSTSNSYSELTEEGDLYICGSTGVVLTNIDEENKVETDARLTVPYLEVDGETVYPDENGNFTVKSGARKITVCAYCFNYSLVDPEVSCQLEGFDRSMKTVRRSELKPVDYTNLAGGEYVFKMKLLSEYGEVQKEFSVKIVKKEALKETGWFRALIVLGLVAFVIAVSTIIGNQRMKKLKEKEEEQTILIREIVEAFAKVIDMKDRYTNGHSTRVAEYTAMLARELGYDDETVEKYRNIALLHDIGKVGISSETLNKPGRLTDDEFKEIKSHSGKGYVVLKDISIMPELAIGARDHHERPDGHGYPKGLKGDEIPRVAQIIAVADTFDAMYSDRPYRKRMNFDKAISIIQEVSGTQLTADVVDAFMRLVEKGEFKAEDDNGGGTFEDITNIHKKQDKKFSEEKAQQKSADSDKESAEEKPAGEESAEEKPAGEESAEENPKDDGTVKSGD